MTARPLLALLAAAALAGCGGADEGATTASAGAKPLGKPIGGSVAPLADCSDWRGGSRDRKLATIDDIRRQVNRTDTGVDTPPLSDREALALFDSACAKSYAEGFRLYVIYARAAGFAPLLR